jgi:general secretion pathway protein M
MTALSLPVRRTVALGLLTAVLAMMWLLGPQPYLDSLAESNAEVARAQSLVARYARLAAEKGALQAQVAAMRAERGRGQGTFPGDNAQLVAANMQDRVKRLVESNAAVLRSTQVLPTRDESGFRQVSIRVTMETEIDGVQKIFHALESANPYLFLNNVDIRSRVIRSRPQAADKAMSLNVTFDIYGYMRVPTS